MTVATSAPALAARKEARSHIVDVLIAERAPKLAGNPLWPVIRPFLYRLLDYGKARKMVDTIAPMGGREAMDFVSDLLSVKITVHGLERIPSQGRVVLIANHPTGIGDGIAVYDALRPVRPDLCFYANSDAHRVVRQFDEVLIPVEWVEAKRTRERTRVTLNMTREAMEAERAIVIFPAGRLARKGPDGLLMDPDWMPSAASIARKYSAPLVPMYLEGPWSTLFHFFNDFSGELRDITLFHELLNKRGRPFALTVGHPIAPEALPADPTEATAALRTHIETVLPKFPDQSFA